MRTPAAASAGRPAGGTARCPSWPNSGASPSPAALVLILHPAAAPRGRRQAGVGADAPGYWSRLRADYQSLVRFRTEPTWAGRAIKGKVGGPPPRESQAGLSSSA